MLKEDSTALFALRCLSRMDVGGIGGVEMRSRKRVGMEIGCVGEIGV